MPINCKYHRTKVGRALNRTNSFLHFLYSFYFCAAFTLVCLVLAVVVTLHCSLPQFLSIQLMRTLLASNEHCKTVATAIIAASYVPLLLEFHRLRLAGRLGRSETIDCAHTYLCMDIYAGVCVCMYVCLTLLHWDFYCGQLPVLPQRLHNKLATEMNDCCFSLEFAVLSLHCWCWLKSAAQKNSIL